METNIESERDSSDPHTLKQELDEREVKRSSTHLTPSTDLQNKSSHRIDPEKYFGLLRGYIRQDWNTVNVPDGVDELRANWVELFFDLIYVACIVHLSSEVTYSLPGESDDRRRLASASSDSYGCSGGWEYAYIFTAFAQFLLLYNGWFYCVWYKTSFVMNQKLDDLLGLMFMVSILCMVCICIVNTRYKIIPYRPL